MQRETEINNVPIFIDEEEDLCIGIQGHEPWFFERQHASALTAFIQQWLDHDPEHDLRLTLQNICYGDKPDGIERWDAMIAAVREHDAKYRRE